MEAVVVVRVVEAGSAESDKFPTGLGVRTTECDDEARAALHAMIERIKTGQV